MFMVIAAIGTVFAAGYLLYLYQRVAFGAVKPEWEVHHFHDVETARVDRVGAAAGSASSPSASTRTSCSRSPTQAWARSSHPWLALGGG